MHWMSDWNDEVFLIPKKGKHFFGVARHYRSPKGKTDNCQMAVTLTIGYHLHLPES